jgi:hypothetical protein
MYIMFENPRVVLNNYLMYKGIMLHLLLLPWKISFNI